MIESPSDRSPAEVPRWDLEEQRLAAAEKVFLVASRWFGNILEFIAKELGHEGATSSPGAPWGAPGRLVGSL